MIALQRLRTLRDAKAFGGWLAAIARNRAADQWRRAAKHHRAHGRGGRDSRRPHRRARRAAAIRTLPDAYRETLVLRLVEGMTGPEIATRTGLTPASVRVNLHRGMKQLRERLGVPGMNDDYLWDRSGEPDPDVEALERRLSALAQGAPPPLVASGAVRNALRHALRGQVPRGARGCRHARCCGQRRFPGLSLAGPGFRLGHRHHGRGAHYCLESHRRRRAAAGRRLARDRRAFDRQPHRRHDRPGQRRARDASPTDQRAHRRSPPATRARHAARHDLGTARPVCGGNCLVDGHRSRLRLHADDGRRGRRAR